MLEKKITFTDYNGVERTEVHCFNLSKAEIMDMQYEVAGGYDAMVRKIIETKDLPALIKIFKELILKSYGIKSDDGRRFIKSEEISNEFKQTEAYTNLYMELATDDKAAAEFINKIIPSELAKELEKNENVLENKTI